VYVSVGGATLAAVSFDLAELTILASIGLFAGVLGGLLGIGGSIVIIPVLVLALKRDFHLAQATAMLVNVCVAVPAVITHQRAGRVEWPLVTRMLPASIVMILVGVQLSTAFDGARLEIFFGIFLLYVIATNIPKLLRPTPKDEDRPAPRIGWLRVSIVGAVNGFAAGLLGIGGGIIAVPLLQLICRLPMRRAIVLSAATMVLTATVGSIRKNLLLPTIDEAFGGPFTITDSLTIAALLAPTAIIGSMFGARYVHRLPTRLIRSLFLVLLAWSASRMLGWT